MENEIKVYDNAEIQNRILVLRNQQVMIDRDLAELYGVDTKRLNEQVKRNIERFPANFMFQLEDKEKAELVAICDRFTTLKHSSSNPYAFTEQGVAMLSAVLKSETAVKMSIQIMNAFVEMRHFLQNNSRLFEEIVNIKVHQKQSDRKIDQLFDLMDNSVLYHIGASLKDLGKKCFAFEILDSSLIPSVLSNL